MAGPERELLWLRRVRDVSHLLATERDLETLLPRILAAAIEITGAERGFLILAERVGEEGALKLRVEAVEGFDRQALRSPENSLSRTVVSRVLERRDGLVTSSDEDSDLLGVTSVQEQDVLSILAVPLRLRGEARGALYLDHRRDALAFTEQDLPILQSFADHAALALETAELRTRAFPPQEQPNPAVLLGASEAIQQVRTQVEAAARTWAPVLILGAEGTGKLELAREIHARSGRAAEPFLEVETTGKSSEQLARELFGDEQGAGALVRAGAGSVVLRDVAELGSRNQWLLLQALRNAQVSAPGSQAPTPIRCRVLALSLPDLRERVDAETFRVDLYYCLDVMRIHAPALCDRIADLPLLLEALTTRVGKTTRLDLSPRALDLLRSYSWPGNLRELENEVQRLLALETTRLSSQHLSPEIREGRGVSQAGPALAGMTLAEVERAMVEAAMRDCEGNKARAARQLGVPRSTLYHLLQRHSLA